jgi:predicted enzyme related to lactoylglutathione lyase
MGYRIKQMSPQLPVTDLARAVKFYVDILGFEIDFRYEDFYAGIIKDGYSIHLKLTGESIAIKPYTDHSPLDMMFLVDNIQELYNELSAHTVQIIQPLREMPYCREFYIADPDGNVIAFLQN